MAISKFIGSWFLAMATLALVNDYTHAPASGAKFAFLSMRGLWQMFHEASLASWQGLVQKSLHPLLWDPVMLAVLKLPAWFVLGVIGAGLCFLGRRRRRVELYTN